MAALGAMVATVALLIGGAWGVVTWWGSERGFRMAEHAAWPKSTPLAALATRSPGGAFVTRAGKHGGDGLGSHSEKHECIDVAAASCAESAVELSAQDRAACQDSWWACHASDGGLLHEHFGVTLRWLDASRIEVSWTELTGLDAAKHRVWGRRSETYRVHTTRSTATPSGTAPCEGLELRAEALSPAR
jgi:hypothetical protein